jgi:lipopolysaccharide export system permease protein
MPHHDNPVLAVIINRYLIREILTPMLAILAVLVSIFASYLAATFLVDAVVGNLPLGAVVLLVAIKIGISLEILLPVTLLLSVVIALGRLYKDSEMIAMASCGIGTGQTLKSVLYLAAAVAALSACASLFIRPAAYDLVYRMKARAERDMDIGLMEGGHFYELQSGAMVFFAEDVHQHPERAKKVLIRSQTGDDIKLIRAEQVRQQFDKSSGRRFLLFETGQMVEFAAQEAGGKITQFEIASYFLDPPPGSLRNYKRKAAPTVHLIRSERLEDIAELQWRLTTPLSTLLLALLGVPLSRTNPRKGKYARVGLAVVIFAIYYNLFVVAKTWVEKGQVPPFPGIWWVPALLAMLLSALLWRHAKR